MHVYVLNPLCGRWQQPFNSFFFCFCSIENGICFFYKLKIYDLVCTLNSHNWMSVIKCCHTDTRTNNNTNTSKVDYKIKFAHFAYIFYRHYFFLLYTKRSRFWPTAHCWQEQQIARESSAIYICFCTSCFAFTFVLICMR